MDETDSAALEASGTATTENSSSGTSKRSRDDEDDDSGPSSKVLKSSDDSDPPSEEEQQAVEAAKTEIEKTNKATGSEEETNPTEEVANEPGQPSVVVDPTPPTEKDPKADDTQLADASDTAKDPSSDEMDAEIPKEIPEENSAPPQEVHVEPAATVEQESQGTIENTVPTPTVETEQMKVETPVAEQPEDAPQEQAVPTPSEPVPADPQAPMVAPEAPPTAPTPAVVQEQVPPQQEQVAPSVPQQDYVEESGQIAALYVGRVIGKGGEMIRDLQARSGAKMDVDSNVPPGQPRTITYAGTRAQVEFAKQLVNMLHQNVPEESLPLGHACQEMVIIPATGVGKVIGRGGEMIRELQSRSQAKIQVDHTGTSGLPAHEKQVSVTGTAEAVTKAREMVLFLVNNPLMEAQQSLNMLVEEKRSGGSAWGSGPPYPNMPNQGMNMQPPPAAAPMDPYGGGGGAYGGGGGGQGGYSQSPYGAQQQMQQPQQQQQPRADGAETMLASKQFMGRIIGSKGVTINDLQQRSGTHIQINQEVAGADSEITITGPPAGIRAAKGMIQEILASGPNHPYAGGGGGSGGGPYGSNPAGAMQGYPGGGGGGYHGAGYGGGGGYPGHSMAAYGGGYPPQQQHPQQQSHQAPSQYGGYDQAMAYGGYGGDPYGGGSGAPGGYGGGGGAPSGYGGPAATSQYPGGAYGASAYGGQQAAAAASYGAYGGGAAGAYGAPSGYAMPAPAPPAAASGPWKMATSADGQVYYYNEQTGQTQWEKPPGIRPRVKDVMVLRCEAGEFKRDARSTQSDGHQDQASYRYA